MTMYGEVPQQEQVNPLSKIATSMELRKSAGRKNTELCGATQTLHNDVFMCPACLVVYSMTLRIRVEL
jgi:hypothetical protein